MYSRMRAKVVLAADNVLVVVSLPEPHACRRVSALAQCPPVHIRGQGLEAPRDGEHRRTMVLGRDLGLPQIQKAESRGLRADGSA